MFFRLWNAVGCEQVVRIAFETAFIIGISFWLLHTKSFPHKSIFKSPLIEDAFLMTITARNVKKNKK